MGNKSLELYVFGPDDSDGAEVVTVIADNKPKKILETELWEYNSDAMHWSPDNDGIDVVSRGAEALNG